MSQNELPPGEEGAEVPQKKSKKKLIIILLIFLILVGGVGGGAWFMLQDPNSIVSQMLNGGGEDGEAVVEGEQSEGEDTEGEGQTRLPATFLTSIPPLTINLADPGTPRYLRLGIDVEATSQQAVNDIKNNNAKIRDAIIILLSSKKYDDLASADGKFTLKHEIISRMNQILGAPRIVQIYFTDFVVQ